MKKIKNKVIIITGDSSGLGKSLIDLLKKENKVYGISRRELKCDYPHYSADVLDYQKINTIVSDIYNKEKRIDLVICCAGIGVAGAVENMSLDDINYQLDVNINGVVNVDKAVISYLREQKFGKIIHISSVAAVAPMSFQAFYSSSKACLNNYSVALANELKPFNVQVSSIMPGDIKTGFTSARIKIRDKDNAYSGRVERNINKMEQDELNGSSVDKVGKEIYKIVSKKKLKEIYTIGFTYKVLVFLIKILPNHLVNKVLYKMYGK